MSLVGLMSFIAGVLNAMTLVLFLVPTTHVTGTLTRIGNETLQIQRLSTLSIIVISFFLGSIVSGYVCHKQKKRLPLICLLFALLFISSVLVQEHTIVLVSLVSFIAGCQNGVPLKEKQTPLRTTHFTGTLSDIGVTIGHLLKQQRIDGTKLLLQCMSLICFVTGSFATIALPKQYTYYAYSISALYTLNAGVAHYYIKQERE